MEPCTPVIEPYFLLINKITIHSGDGKPMCHSLWCSLKEPRLRLQVCCHLDVSEKPSDGGGRETEASPRQEDPVRREGHTSQRSEELLSITRGLRIGWEYLHQKPKRQRQPHMSKKLKNCHLGSWDFRRKMVPEAYSR